MQPVHRRILLALAASVSASLGAPAAAEPAPSGPVEPIGRFPVVVHLATRGGEPLLTADEVAAQLGRADRNFAVAGIAFDAREIRPLPEGHATLATIRDRHRLRRHLVARTINVFLVEEILDPRPSKATRRAAAKAGIEPSGRLGGAHILAKGRVPETYLIVSRRSAWRSLTHELGHFFGAPHHGDPENFMSYGPRPHRFDEAQVRCFRRVARRYLRRRTLRPVTPLIPS